MSVLMKPTIPEGKSAASAIKEEVDSYKTIQEQQHINANFDEGSDFETCTLSTSDTTSSQHDNSEQSFPYDSSEDLSRVDNQQIVTVQSKYKRFCAVLLTMATFWILMFGIGIYLYVEEKRKCKLTGNFELFGICLLVYINLRYWFELSIVAMVYCKHYRKQIPSDTDSTASQVLVIGSHRLACDAIDEECFGKTCIMGQKKLDASALETCIHEYLNGSECHDGSLMHDKLLRALSSLEKLKKKLFSVSEKNFKTMSAAKTHQPIALRKLNQIFLSLEVIPLLSIIFYIIIGVTSPQSSVIFTKDNTGGSACYMLTVFNWILVSIFIVQSIVKLIPSAVGLLYGPKYVTA